MRKRSINIALLWIAGKRVKDLLQICVQEYTMLLSRKCLGRLIIGFTSLYNGHVVATGCKKLENLRMMLPLLVLCSYYISQKSVNECCSWKEAGMMCCLIVIDIIFIYCQHMCSKGCGRRYCVM